MISTEKQMEVRKTVEQLYAQKPDWIAFYRETLGMKGIVRQMFPTREALAAFEQTESYQEILRMLAKLRKEHAAESAKDDPTRVITVRLPKSMHEALRNEAFEHRTSMNKLCISKLLQFIDGECVPSETE